MEEDLDLREHDFYDDENIQNQNKEENVVDKQTSTLLGDNIGSAPPENDHSLENEQSINNDDDEEFERLEEEWVQQEDDDGKRKRKRKHRKRRGRRRSPITLPVRLPTPCVFSTTLVCRWLLVNGELKYVCHPAPSITCN